MTLSAWLFLGTLSVLAISLLLFRRAGQRTDGIGTSWIARCSWLDEEKDTVFLELGKGIFSAGDWHLVSQATPREFASGFYNERTLLALEWIRRTRNRMRKLVREHRRAVRVRPDVTTTSELKLAFEFISFELASGILYYLIVLRGPSGATSLLDCYLSSALKLRSIVQQIAPTAASTLNGIVKTNS